MNGERFGKRLDIPQAGEHSADVARELGCDADEIRALVEDGVLGVAVEGASQPKHDPEKWEPVFGRDHAQ